MSLTQRRTTEVILPDIGPVEIKHITAKEYHNFRTIEDREAQTRFLLKVSLGLDDAQLDDVPMSFYRPLIESILKVNGLSDKQEEAAVKN